MIVKSARAYAKLVGASHTAVNNAIKQGLIKPLPDGSIDTEQADVAWRPRVQRNAVRVDPKSVGSPDYYTARAIREHYLARLARIEFDEKVGKLVSRDEVQVAAFTKARTVRDNLLNIPDRLAAVLAAETDVDKVHKILTEEIRKALEDLAGSGD